jgi:hypothetical protein
MSALTPRQEAQAASMVADGSMPTLAAAREYVEALAKRPDRSRVMEDGELLAKRFERGGPLR